MSLTQYRIDVETAMRGIPNVYVEEAVNILRKAKRDERSVYIMGNGGSAATAGHFANDLVKMCGIKAYSIPAMVPLVTAYGNDNQWENMFDLTLRSFLSPNEVVIGISCSGNSANVVNAMRTAHDYEKVLAVNTIALIGADRKCSLAQCADVVIDVPFKDIRVQEDCHMVICHAIAGMLR